ncbi:MAG TPA: sulfatase-like hydrolase/transferase [Puia sp.]|nr:sulfatase-like hydrolase/transferase [Puia sp.]
MDNGFFPVLKPYRRSGKRVLSVVLLLLLMHLFLRILFWLTNRTLFPPLSFPAFGRVIARGIQQDWVALLLVNLPTILLLMLLAWTRRATVRRALAMVATWSFVLGNGAAIALNCIDIGYFRFGRHRANRDLGFVLGDSLGSFRSIFTSYWPLILLFALLVVLLTGISRFLPRDGSMSTGATPGPAVRVRRNARITTFLLQVLAGLLIFFSSGLPGRPIIPATPLLSVCPEALPIAQNSCFTFLYSCLRGSRELRPVHYFPRGDLDRIVQTNHLLGPSPPAPPRRFDKRNVVVFILESFSRCYLTAGNPQKAITPFFDSLLRKSLFFPHSFANGFTSNQGIVSILGGLPALTDEPFYYSDYANTPLHSIGNILDAQGYNTNFLMGAERDHFGFGKFASMAGLDHSYWKEDFDDDRYDDGNWGIFDGPFLQYGARILSEKPQPFLAVFYTISAHPPYTIPADLQGRFAVPVQPAPQRAISYTDYAFRQLFDSIRHRPWYRNTLFVFCADHWLDPDQGKGPYNPLEASTIPIFIFDPLRDTADWRPCVAGQVDLAPTVLDLLGYTGAYTGFGRSLLDKTVADSDRYVINRVGAVYQVIADNYVLGYNEETGKSSYLYRYVSDGALKHDLLADPSCDRVRKRLETWVKADIQAYRQALSRRSLQ